VRSGEGSSPAPGVILDGRTWLEAEPLLTPEAIVVLPLGAAAKEHGPHLRLENDRILADDLKRRVAERAAVVVAPTVPYHFYPAFVEYPGSVSLRLETARDLVVDIARSYARFGPRRFYVLNTGVSTVRALAPTAAILAAEGVLLHYTDLRRILGPVERALAQQERGTHADEIETSILLFIAPDAVDLRKAVRDCAPDRPGGLTRDPAGAGTYSASGIWGDPTLATAEKGRRAVEALVEGIVADIEALRVAPLPAGPRPSG
jgi:creatinine amidohydrolase